jgi:hypothetical protein
VAMAMKSGRPWRDPLFLPGYAHPLFLPEVAHPLFLVGWRGKQQGKEGGEGGGRRWRGDGVGEGSGHGYREIQCATSETDEWVVVVRLETR